MSVDCADGEPVDVYEAGVRRSRKDRRCDACEGPIARGDLYHRTALLFEGAWEVYERCARCEAMHSFLSPLVGMLGDGDQICDERLDCGHKWSDNFEGEPPLAVQALAFLTPAEAQVLVTRAPAFNHRYVDQERLQGPIEREDARIARLLAGILGERFPTPPEPRARDDWQPDGWEPDGEAPEVQAHA